MVFYRRRLPHWVPDDAAVSVTRRLAGSYPPDPVVQREELQDWRVASVIVDALRYGESVRQFYHLYAWVIMPNHVHVIFQPRIAMSSIMRQDESFDHWVRSPAELRNLIAYVENNPVRAGLAYAPCQWPWSSAGLMADDKNRCRGRDASYPAPPAQIRTSAIDAYGSYLGWITAKRCSG